MAANNSCRTLIALCLGLLIASAFGQAAAINGPSRSNPAASSRVKVQLDQLPLRFEANRGQADKRVRFISRGPGYTLFLTSREAVLSLATPAAKQGAPGKRMQPEAAASPRTPPAVVRLELTGANRHPAITEEDQLPTKTNYFIGNDPTKWRTNIPNYAQVRYRDVYPGIDLIYYGNQHRLEHDFVVAPGADPAQINFALHGVSKLHMVGGDLVMSAAHGELRLLKPVIYQSSGGSRHSVPGGYVLKSGNRVGFKVAEFDRQLPLVIDPVLSYSTYLGGDGDDQGYSIAVDSSGNAYVAGSTSSTNFPTSNAYQSSYGGGVFDAFVTKFSPDGSLVYSTYLGGSAEDAAHSIFVDSSGNAYVTGTTYSTNFPVTPGVFQTALANSNGGNAFVTKLNSTGTALVYSTYLGGGSGGSFGDVGWGITVDSSGNTYVAGITGSGTFPTTPGAFQTANANSNGGNAFVTKLNSTGTALVYSTYLGGSNNGLGITPNGAANIAVDSSGDAYVTGQTESINFPTTPGAFQTTGGGFETSAFVTKLNSTGTALIYSTYLGGTDYGLGIAVDSGGNAYVTGWTGSSTFPTTPGAFQTTFGGNRNAFVTELNPTGTALVYSTYLGGTGQNGFTADTGNAITLDSSDDAYITGFTNSTNFPTTSGAYQTSLLSTQDNAFVTELNSTGTALVYSTYLGGSNLDTGSGIAVDSNGNMYVTGETNSDNFPTTSDAFQASLSGPQNAFVAKISAASTLTSQTITVTDAAPASAADDSTFMVAATASSDLPVSISASGACTGSGTGSATITMTAATGTCTVTYTQAGNGTYAAAPTLNNMTTATAAVLAPTFSLSSPTGTQTVQPGNSAQYTITVTAQDGTFSNAVTLTASDLPNGATASFMPPSVTPGSTSASSTLTIQTTQAAAVQTAGDSRWPLAFPALALIGLLFLPGKRRRRWITSLLLLIASLGVFTALTACGGGFGANGVNNSTTPENYTVTVTGTSGDTQQTTTVQITVE
jgi:hypothetical protein